MKRHARGQAVGLAWSILLAISVVGCSPYAYVNIPPQTGDVARHSPNSSLVRQVYAAALGAVLADRPLPAPVAIELPDGADVETHADVAERIGSPAVSPYNDSVTPMSTVRVQQVRVRGAEAQVDVVRPGLGGRDQLVTVYLTWAPFSDWTAQRVREWRGAVPPRDEAPSPRPEPTYEEIEEINLDEQN